MKLNKANFSVYKLNVRRHFWHKNYLGETNSRSVSLIDGAISYSNFIVYTRTNSQRCILHGCSGGIERKGNVRVCEFLEKHYRSHPSVPIQPRPTFVLFPRIKTGRDNHFKGD